MSSKIFRSSGIYQLKLKFILIVDVLENCEIVINKMFEISSRGKLDLEEDILATIKNFNCNYETR